MKTKRKPLTKLQLSARGQPCTVRIFGVCNHNPETTVLAHLNGGGGGMKHPDLFACFACFDCHEWLDGGYTRTDATRKDRDMAHYQAIHRTQNWWLENGYILICAGAEKMKIGHEPTMTKDDIIAVINQALSFLEEGENLEIETLLLNFLEELEEFAE